MNKPFSLARSIALLAASATLLLAACGPTSDSDDGALPPQAIEANNRGVGLMGQYKNEEARQVFAELAEAHPEWLDVRVNEAIATLNRQREGDERRALAMVERVLAVENGHARAHYIAGLMRFYLGEAELALPHFQRVIEMAPEDAYAHYFTGQVLDQLGEDERALERYLAAIELDPYLRSAYYGSALLLRQSGQSDAAREKLAAYQRFADNPRAQLAEFRYTRMGPLAEAVTVGDESPEDDVQVAGGSMLASAVDHGALPGRGAASLTTADVDGDGTLDLFLADAAGSLLLIGDGGSFRPAGAHPLTDIEDVVAAAWGDVDNDGALDVYLCRRGDNLLLSSALDWKALEGAADVADGGDCADVGLFDADHDGDLDVFVVNVGGDNELYNNNLDGSWRRLSESAEARLEGYEAGRAVMAVDLDADRDVDIVVLHDNAPNQVFINDRLWRYREPSAFADFAQADAVAVTVADVDASGQPALVTVDAQGVLRAWEPDEAGHWRGRVLGRADALEASSAALASLDLSGDGRPEILLHHAGGFEIMVYDGAAGELATAFAETDPIDALAPVLVEAARGPSLLARVPGDGTSSLREWAPGDGRGRFVALSPSGRSERSDGMRSNASGIGTAIAARTGARWSLLDSFDRHSAPGQSLQPVAFGVGGREGVDFVRFEWSDGVLQTEMGLAAGQVHRVSETQRQLASCPVLFAYDGEGFKFVSDLLGVAGIGFLHAPGEYSQPRPWEYFRFPEGSIAPRDGRYVIKIGEPMEEVAYLDSARLHVHDLPEGWSLVLDERMHTGGGPAPTGRPVFYRDARLIDVERAINERGEDVTDALRRVDQRAADVGRRDRRFLGRLADEHVLTLEFGRVINPAGDRPVLLIDGWVEYPYSQTVFAAWQAGADYAAPTLEARAGGQWQTVHEHFGYPAGMPREMSLPLDALPPETTALRLRTNLEIYFDRIAVVQAEPRPDEASSTVLSVDGARLSRSGFARRDTLEQRRPDYDYADRSAFWDTKAPTGFYTALGPVDELVADGDDAFAVIGPGEEVQFEFLAPPEPPAGHERHVVLEVRGYAKDMDLYTRDGETVGPMPGDPRAARSRDLHEKTLTRFRGGY